MVGIDLPLQNKGDIMHIAFVGFAASLCLLWFDLVSENRG